MNLKEYLADGPKKMFSMFEGLVTVELVDNRFCPYILGAKTYYNGDGTYNDDGTVLSSKYRVLYTLEEAAQLGFVKREFWGRVKYRDTCGKICATGKAFTSKAQFEEARGYEKYIFISFVDDELNECPPPSEREWVETVPEFMKIK
jgi:hypothetical protein